MSRLEDLQQRVAWLFEARSPSRNDWADWLWAEHQPYVAHAARELAVRFGANVELAEASGWLHDIADAVMSRFADGHEEASITMARQIMYDVGYSQDDVAIVVDDALRLHSCYDGKAPRSLEGKVLATADALAHLKTDFYSSAAQRLVKEMSPQEIKNYALKKSARDFNDKIRFDEVREETRADYERIKNYFSRL